MVTMMLHALLPRADMYCIGTPPSVCTDCYAKAFPACCVLPSPGKKRNRRKQVLPLYPWLHDYLHHLTVHAQFGIGHTSLALQQPYLVEAAYTEGSKHLDSEHNSGSQPCEGLCIAFCAMISTYLGCIVCLQAPCFCRSTLPVQPKTVSAAPVVACCIWY